MSLEAYNFLEKNIEKIDFNFHKIYEEGYSFCFKINCETCNVFKECSNIFPTEKPLLKKYEVKKFKKQYPEYFL